MSAFHPGEQALVTHIQRFSLHDGPGIRTTVFLKGCPLRCPWCCNPECIPAGVELVHQKSLCPGAGHCGLCIRACPAGCFQATEDAAKPPAFDRRNCDLCMACEHVCPSGALVRAGQPLTGFDVMEYCRQDMEAYSLSGGGITLSGGEPLARPALTLDILRRARQLPVHCALESCGWFDMDNPQTYESLGLLDLLIFDLKHSDGDTHRRFTGVDTQRIHGNLRRLARDFPRLPVHVRAAVIPGFNADEGVLRDLARLAAGITTVRDMELVPFHSFGASKYGYLGRPQSWRDVTPCSAETTHAWQIMVRRELHRERSEGSHAATA